jgi:hypothetical protein
MWMTLLTAALAAKPAPPAGYEEIKSDHDCVIYAGPKDAQGVAPVFAVCTWPDVDPGRIDTLLTDTGAHDTYFSAVGACDCQPADGGSLCHQRNVASGIADREIDLFMARSASGETIRHTWTPAPTQTGAADGNVQAVKSEGAWTITPNPSGGSWVTYELYYNPGGSVPSWVIRWFQGSGIAELLGEMRAKSAG